MKILLSPAKSLDYTRSFQKPFTSIPLFTKESKALIDILRSYSDADIAKLMSLSPSLASINSERFKQWSQATTEDEYHKSCIEVFNGEAYKGLAGVDFSKETFLTAQSSLRILSGLYGILKPLDLIAPYRLEMGTKLHINPSITSLYAFWGTKISDFLNTEEEESIVNLASIEYFKVIQTSKLKADVITPVFKELKNGQAKTIMMYAKHARGAMASFILNNKLNSTAEIKNFCQDNYSFDEHLSSEKEWVFVR